MLTWIVRWCTYRAWYISNDVSHVTPVFLVSFANLVFRPEDVRIPFERFGTVKDVYLPKDYYSGYVRPLLKPAGSQDLVCVWGKRNLCSVLPVFSPRWAEITCEGNWETRKWKWRWGWPLAFLSKGLCTRVLEILLLYVWMPLGGTMQRGKDLESPPCCQKRKKLVVSVEEPQKGNAWMFQVVWSFVSEGQVARMLNFLLTKKCSFYHFKKG